MAYRNRIPVHETYVVFIDSTTGTRMVYQLGYGSLEIEHEEPEDLYWDSPVVPTMRPNPPKLTVTGSVLRGKIWRDAPPDFFPEPQQSQIKYVPKEIEE